MKSFSKREFIVVVACLIMFVGVGLYYYFYRQGIGIYVWLGIDNHFTNPLMSNLLAADAPEVAKKHMRILAKESADNLRLFISIDDKVLKNSFETELAMAVQNRENLFKASRTMKDEAFEKELKDIFGDIPEF